MTKIYLVYMKGISIENAYRKSVWAVFTNKRKAQVYCRYKKEVTDQNWLTLMKMKQVEWILEDERIWTDDYTYKLKQIQMEKLPF